MSPILQLLYDYVLEQPILAYYRKTGYDQRREAQEILTERLRRQLTPPQQDLLEELLLSCAATQSTELEAMFLAAFDHAMALSRGGQSLPLMAQK